MILPPVGGSLKPFNCKQMVSPLLKIQVVYIFMYYFTSQLFQAGEMLIMESIGGDWI